MKRSVNIRILKTLTGSFRRGTQLGKVFHGPWINQVALRVEAKREREVLGRLPRLHLRWEAELVAIIKMCCGVHSRSESSRFLFESAALQQKSRKNAATYTGMDPLEGRRGQKEGSKDRLRVAYVVMLRRKAVIVV
ncbi:hypothetical protein CRG98_043996 [Punica granatum]|uniref:Uncharacterized protein n=1 Tax=Punica granatum TaxID=22663 RepID=A0A2I0HV15_PUNGR|nr:hypothetical protein CRG98_043996 [Punica granatum]